MSSPSHVRARRERRRNDDVRTSFLSAPAAAALEAVGLEPVGDVMGCVATQLTYQFLGRCGAKRWANGYRRASRQPTPVVLVSGSGSARSSYLCQIRASYASALSRLSDEARALGADGVVGIDLDVQRYETLREFVAVGTAVRARSHTRPRRLFTTDLRAREVASLMLAGWVPVHLAVAVQVALRHSDWRTSNQLYRTNRSNNEIESYSELIARAGDGARTVLRSAATHEGADGCLLSARDVSTWEARCGTGLEGEDYVAQCVLTGTSVAHFGSRTASPEPLRIMPLDGRGRR